MTEKVKIYEEQNKKGLPMWAWLLPLLLVLALALWFFNRHHEPATTAAAPMSDQTKPDTGAGTQVAQAWTAASIANSIRNNGRVAFSDNDVHFATGSASLAGDSQAVLDQTVQALKDNSDWKMQVVGHTDSVGSTPANDQLSQQRANSVMAYLTMHGVDQGRLSLQAKGASEPVAPNASDAGRAENRRVELIKI